MNEDMDDIGMDNSEESKINSRNVKKNKNIKQVKD